MTRASLVCSLIAFSTFSVHWIWSNTKIVCCGHPNTHSCFGVFSKSIVPSTIVCLRLFLIYVSTSSNQTSIGLTSRTSDVTNYLFWGPFLEVSCISSFLVTMIQGSTWLSNAMYSFIEEIIPLTLSVSFSKSNFVMPSKHLLRCSCTLTGSLVYDNICNRSSFDKKKNRGNLSYFECKYSFKLLVTLSIVSLH